MPQKIDIGDLNNWLKNTWHEYAAETIERSDGRWRLSLSVNGQGQINVIKRPLGLASAGVYPVLLYEGRTFSKAISIYEKA